MHSRRKNTDQGKKGKGRWSEGETEAGLLERREKGPKSEGETEEADHERGEGREADHETEDEVTLYLMTDN